MKPFLLLQLRPNNAASEGEYKAFLKFGGLTKPDLQRVRMESGDLPEINLNNYSGIILGGGPSNVSDVQEKKKDYQIKFENWLAIILNEIIKKDFPFFGSCYGFGLLVHCAQGGIESKKQYNESLGAIDQHIRPEGLNDPLLQDLPEKFKAISAHKEACQKLPTGSVWLIKGENCPYQMFRLKKNIYAAQFHVELDAQGTADRMDIYMHAGYFLPEEAEQLKSKFANEDVSVAPKIFRNFVDRYKKD